MRIVVSFAVLAVTLLAQPVIRGQFVAFNDHAPGPGTAPNTTTWNVLGDAPGSSGALKDVNTGAALPVTLTIKRSASGVAGAGTQGNPAAGTPLYNVFNGFVDFQGTLNPSIELTAGGLVTYTFSGLNPARRYSFKGSAVRGNAPYTDRWTVFEIIGADSFTSAHTTNALTTAEEPSLTSSQVAINTGVNNTPETGDMADWENIDPGADGEFAVACQQYTGPVPGGSSGGIKGYGMTGIRLEEFNANQTPATIINQPQSQVVEELHPVTFTVGAIGNPVPTYQWYENNVPISSATNVSYSILSAPLIKDGAVFKVVVANTISNVTYLQTSSNAVLTIAPDTMPPQLLAAQAENLTQVKVIFSERLSPSTATNPANFAITSAAGTLNVSNAMLDATQTNVLLEVSPLTEGLLYTLTVKGVRDQSAAGNLIAPNSQATFGLATYTPQDLGGPALPGTLALVPGGYNATASGVGIGGAADQGLFAYQEVTGDFDKQVRVQSLGPSDPWAAAGLMVRETLDAGSRSAATLATPAMVGSFFEWRSATNGASQSSGYAVVNYPNTWLRLKRSGNTFSGFASYDAQTWTPLGSVTMTFPSQVYFGMAVSSHSPSQSTTVQLRNLEDVTSSVVGLVAAPTEPLGPCSRRTPLVISELMYQPAPRADGRNIEYVELYNSSPWWEDISGYRLTGDTLYTLPAGTILAGVAFLVIAPVPADLQSVYGITNVLGPSVTATKKTGLIQLRDEQDTIVLEFEYGTTLPWPAGASGTGHSIVLARPSYGEADPRAWAISDVAGGSPGGPEAYRPSPLRNVVINEFLARPDASDQGYIELYNHSFDTVDLSGCVLTDDAQINRFIVPSNTFVGPAAFIAFDTGQLGFALNPSAGLLLFKTPDASRVLDAVSYRAQGLTIALGRWPDGASEFYPLRANTPGNPNSDILIGDIVLNELMYDPISGNDDDQFVELYNQGTNAVDLAGWSFTDEINFTFGANTVLAPGAYLVVARNLTNLLSHYPQLNSSNAVGNFTGKLSHKGGRLALARPEAWLITTLLVDEDEVTYGVGGRWGQWAHGGGSSLELIHPGTNHRLASNWADSDESGKSSWANLEFTGVLDNGFNYGASVDLVQLGMLDVGECLVDNVEVRPSAGGANYLANPGFENGLNGWSPQGDHIRSSLEANLGGYQSSRCLHLRASDGMWTMFNSVQGSLTNLTLRSGSTATLRLKGRWLCGSPEVLMRLHGNWLELAGRLPVPTNLGTPGLPNSRAVASPGPAIYEVQHSPALPIASQPVLVTARFHDENGVVPTLFYRTDTGPAPTPSYSSVTMVDDGTGADAIADDGIYSARIPARSAGTVVAFVIRARNALGGSTVFPEVINDNSGLPRECVVRFGDERPLGSFDHEHVWMTQNWINRWASLGGLSNENHDGTFVDGYSGRIIYNWVGRYAGSPYHQYTGSPVGTWGGQHWTLPEDDKFLGSASFNKQHLPGNGPLDDDTIQREQTSFWMARQLGVPWNYRRYYILYVNGNRHGPLMEDSQVPGAEMIKQRWPQDDNGFLYKNNGWFEGATTIDGGGYMGFNMPSWSVLGRFVTTSNGVPGQYKVPRYRWMYWVRQYPDSANNFTNIFSLITTANLSTANPAYYANWEALADTEEFMRMSALEHATADWDCWFTQNQWNMYIYKPTRGKFTALKWDWNITLGSSGSWSSDGSDLFNIGGNDGIMARFQNYTPYRRAYLRAFKEIADKAMNNASVDRVLDKKYAAFAANGLTSGAYGLAVRDPGAAGLKSWIRAMHNSLLRALTNQGVANVSFTLIGVTNYYETDTNVIVLTGTAPVEVRSIMVNGAPLPVTWTTVRNWRIVVPLGQVTNDLVLNGLDVRGNVQSNLTASLEVVNTNFFPVPLKPVVINEWLAENADILSDPADGQVHDWLELYNPNFAIVDLSGYYLTDKLSNRTKWQIPAGTIMPPNGFLLVWADGGLISADHDLHASFKLAKSGGTIGLCDRQANLISAVAYGPQRTDVSQGRWPDGADNVYFLTAPTAKGPNLLVNSPPALVRLPDQSVWTGNLLTFTASASDPDAPPQTLAYSLDPGAPPEAAIDSSNGEFTWLVPANEPLGTNLITVRVTDNGIPPLSNAQVVVVVVQGIVINNIGLSTNGQPTFAWSAVPGRTYRVEWKANLEDAAWQRLEDVYASTTTVSYADQTTPAANQRFYRVTMLP